MAFRSRTRPADNPPAQNQPATTAAPQNPQAGGGGGGFRNRSRGPAPAAGGAPAGGSQALRFGTEANQTAAREREANAARQAANSAGGWRFLLKPGESADVVVLDAQVAALPNLYEHEFWPRGQKSPTYEVCIKEYDHCAACETVKDDGKPNDSYYIMTFTILDVREFTDKNNNLRKYSRRMCTVKLNARDDFVRVLEACQAKHGTIRGCHMFLARGQEQNSPRTGKPVPFDDGNGNLVVYDLLSEQELVAEFGHGEIKAQDTGKVLKAANADLQPVDYTKVFPDKTAEQLRTLYGGAAPAGSQQEVREAFAAQQGAAPAGGAAQPAPAQGGTRSRFRSGGGAPAGGQPQGGGQAVLDDDIPF